MNKRIYIYILFNAVINIALKIIFKRLLFISAVALRRQHSVINKAVIKAGPRRTDGDWRCIPTSVSMTNV